MCITKIPDTLYRGDCGKDRNGEEVRYLRTEAWKKHLYTNLIHGGNPAEIFFTELGDLVKKHIDPGWHKTHFLSFTSKESQAQRYALHIDNEKYAEQIIYNEYINCRIEKDKWDFIIAKLYKHRVDYKEYTSYRGVYLGSYLDDQNQTHNICLIDAQEYLKQMSPNAQKAYNNAKRDQEWLVLPLDPMPDNSKFLSALFVLPGDIDFYSRIDSLTNSITAF
ncbi:hypothetical protein [Butyricimonas virosa]|jgi:hypothetical protein|uniref:hypothetical protein n=1 Tax=Butyricimonas virosa TaxID=544645 RepID=UPI0032C13DE3